jgi:hypothetical protein
LSGVPTSSRRLGEQQTLLRTIAAIFKVKKIKKKNIQRSCSVADHKACFISQR